MVNSMNAHAGYWVDLDKVALGDSPILWIQAMPLGKYNHPVYGEINITPEKVQKFASNVNTKVREQDLDIDYDHKTKDGRAAGWVKQADARTDGLWLSIEWTPDAYSALKKREYRYFSPEYTDEWTHPKTGVKHKDVLLGGALTNRPFLKDILPINLSEVFDTRSNNMADELNTRLRTELGLPADASDEDVVKAVQAQKQAGEPKTPPSGEPQATATNPPVNEPVTAGSTGSGVGATVQASEDVVKQLAEAQKQIAELQKANRLSEVNRQLAEWNSQSSGNFAIPTKLHEPIRLLMLSTTEDDAKKFADIMVELAKTGMVELGERVQSNPGNSGLSDATKRFDDKVKAKMADKIAFSEAVAQVAQEDPTLYEEYRSESYNREV